MHGSISVYTCMSISVTVNFKVNMYTFLYIDVFIGIFLCIYIYMSYMYEGVKARDAP